MKGETKKGGRKKESAKKEVGLGFQPVARSFDEVIDRFGIDLAEDEDKNLEPVPDIFRADSDVIAQPEPQKAPKPQKPPKAEPSKKTDKAEPALPDKSAGGLGIDMGDYFKRLEVTAGAADALWARERADADNQQNQRQNGGGKNGFGPPEEYRPDNNQYNDRHNDRRERRERPAGAARRPDFFLSRWADKAVEKYYQIVPRRSLAKAAPVKERLMVLLAVLAVIGVITGTISLIMAATPQNISGKWQLTDNDKMTFEFNRGKVVVMILSEGRWVEDRRGEYTTKKQDDKNLLVIIYEDGVTRHLYYEIDGDTAVFTNVDTNIQQTGIRS